MTPFLLTIHKKRNSNHSACLVQTSIVNVHLQIGRARLSFTMATAPHMPAKAHSAEDVHHRPKGEFSFAFPLESAVLV